MAQVPAKVQVHERPVLPDELANFYTLGKKYFDKGLYDAAWAILQKVVISAEENRLYSCQEAIPAFITLTCVYRVRGEYCAADITIERGIRFALKAMGAKNPSTITVMCTYLQCSAAQSRA